MASAIMAAFNKIRPKPVTSLSPTGLGENPELPDRFLRTGDAPQNETLTALLERSYEATARSSAAFRYARRSLGHADDLHVDTSQFLERLAYLRQYPEDFCDARPVHVPTASETAVLVVNPASELEEDLDELANEQGEGPIDRARLREKIRAKQQAAGLLPPGAEGDKDGGDLAELQKKKYDRMLKNGAQLVESAKQQETKDATEERGQVAELLKGGKSVGPRDTRSAVAAGASLFLDVGRTGDGTTEICTSQGVCRATRSSFPLKTRLRTTFVPTVPVCAHHQVNNHHVATVRHRRTEPRMEVTTSSIFASDQPALPVGVIAKALGYYTEPWWLVRFR
ncbi:unnamed protein product [Amoebophrya sp. A120]|nr:unnamed protein product [Amoebophrya sp. A120]|eukprot:GSA120T00013086001.1